MTNNTENAIIVIHQSIKPLNTQVNKLNLFYYEKKSKNKSRL